MSKIPLKTKKQNKNIASLPPHYEGAASRKKTTTMTSKLNNEGKITDAMRERLDRLYTAPERVAKANEKLKKIDPNMFFKITNKTEHYLLGAEQIVHKEANGTAFPDNMDLYFELNNEDKKPSLIKVQYDNLTTGMKDQYSILVIIKIDGIYYARDRSNFKDECKELGFWFLERNDKIYVRCVLCAVFTLQSENEVNCNFTTENGSVWKLIEQNTAILERRKKISKFELKQRTKYSIYNRKGKRIR